MNLPNIPTDNIYKFSAIFGLVIYIGSIYLYQASDRNIHDAEIRSELSHDKEKSDSIYSDYISQMYNTRLDILQERMKTLPDNNLYIENFLKDNAELEKKFLENLKVSNEYKNSMSNSFKTDADLAYYEYEQGIYRIFAKTLMVFGILLIAWGFASWYFKHQIYIDAEIKWKGQAFRELLKNADEIRKSESGKTEDNDEIPLDESNT